MIQRYNRTNMLFLNNPIGYALLMATSADIKEIVNLEIKDIGIV